MSVLHATLRCLDKLQWWLQRTANLLAAPTCKVVAVGVEAFQEETGMVVAGNGKPRKRHLHVLMEPLPVEFLNALHIGCQRIIIKGGGYIGIEPMEILYVIFLIHQPLGVAKERDGKVGAQGYHPGEDL